MAFTVFACLLLTVYAQNGTSSIGNDEDVIFSHTILFDGQSNWMMPEQHRWMMTPGLYHSLDTAAVTETEVTPDQVTILTSVLDTYKVNFFSKTNPFTELTVASASVIADLTNGKVLQRGDSINLDCGAFSALVLILLGQTREKIVTLGGSIYHSRNFYLSANDLAVANALPIRDKGQWIVHLYNDLYIGLTEDSWKIMSMHQWVSLSHTKFIEEITTSHSVYSAALDALDLYTWILYKAGTARSLVPSGRAFHFDEREVDEDIVKGLLRSFRYRPPHYYDDQDGNLHVIFSQSCEMDIAGTICANSDEAASIHCAQLRAYCA